tara:strand:+ start:311 stop:856 length:546 start_codon:yes stop_codon:yes gene_type:complete
MNTELAQMLIAMAEEDQRMLQKLFESGELPSDEYHPEMKAVHERQTASLKEIISSHSWPGISLVGHEGAKSAWLIVQHAVSDQEFMSECVELLRHAVAKDDAEGWQFAFLQDRVNTMSGLEQVYGTQFDVDENGWPTPFPIVDRESVNERRAALGLNSLEERLEQMHERERLRRQHQSSVG